MAATAPRSTDRKWRRRSVLRAVTGRSRRPCCPVMACGSATQPPTTPRRRPRCGAGDPACRAPIVCASRSVPGWTPRSGPPTPPGASTTASGRCADATRSGAGPSPGTPRPDRTARAGARPLGCGSAPRTSARRACAPPKPSAPSEPGPSDRVLPSRPGTSDADCTTDLPGRDGSTRSPGRRLRARGRRRSSGADLSPPGTAHSPMPAVMEALAIALYLMTRDGALAWGPGLNSRCRAAYSTSAHRCRRPPCPRSRRRVARGFR